MLPKELRVSLETLAALLSARKARLACAESCTGGMIASACTELSGSSQWFERGFVTYSNEAKTESLGVTEATLEAHGAVSEETAREMVQGVLAHSHAHWALAVTGVAGPSGGSAAKPVGMICFAWGAREGAARSQTLHFKGDRATIRAHAVQHALDELIALVRTAP